MGLVPGIPGSSHRQEVRYVYEYELHEYTLEELADKLRQSNDPSGPTDFLNKVTLGGRELTADERERIIYEMKDQDGRDEH